MTTSTITPSTGSAEVTGAPAAPAPHAANTGLLLLRVVTGLVMAAHGAQKLFGWFGGGGLEGTGQFFEMSGYPSGTTMAALAGLSEVLGGLGLVLGLLTPLAGAAVVGTMINAVAVKWGGGFFAPAGVEYELLLVAAAAAVTVAGPGRYAVDRLLPGLRNHRLSYGIGAVVVGVVSAAVVLLLRK